MKILRLICFLILPVMMLPALFLPGVALAQDEGISGTDNFTPTSPPVEEPQLPPDTITLSTEYPKLEAIATGSFEFNVKLEYMGQIDRIFDLNVTVPAGWDAYMTPQYDTVRISSITLEQSFTTTTKNVKVAVSPPTASLAEPGEYKINLEASSDNIVGEIDLIAKITARYELRSAPASQRYDTKAKAGQNNTYSILVGNAGTASIDNITFSSDKPEGWEITFKPDKIDQLNILDAKTIDVNIKPPPKTVAGDYMITLSVSGKQASATGMNIRVTVVTPTIWGWVGVGIIAVVVVGLVLIFMRFGRR